MINTILNILACAFVFGIAAWILIMYFRRNQTPRKWLVYWHEVMPFGGVEHGQTLVRADTEEEALETFFKEFQSRTISGSMEVK